MGYDGMPSARKTNICIYCKKACGGCSWSRYDTGKKRVAFEPVPGWTAERVPWRNHHGVVCGYTYHIHSGKEINKDQMVIVKRIECKCVDLQL